MSRVLFMIFCVQLLLGSASAQDFNGKNLKWRLPENTDPRFKAFFGSTGYSFGSEGSSLVVENLTSKKLIVKCKVTIYDLCGNSQVKEMSRTVNPLSTSGSSAWLEGIEYNPPCTEKKKYSERFYSKIQKVVIDVLNVQEINAGKPIVANNNTTPVNKALAASCNAGLPRILISETGEYYAKTTDGSYKQITKEMYEVYKGKKTEEEKVRHIQDCTGNPINQIRFKVPNMNQ